MKKQYCLSCNKMKTNVIDEMCRKCFNEQEDPDESPLPFFTYNNGA